MVYYACFIVFNQTMIARPREGAYTYLGRLRHTLVSAHCLMGHISELLLEEVPNIVVFSLPTRHLMAHSQVRSAVPSINLPTASPRHCFPPRYTLRPFTPPVKPLHSSALVVVLDLNQFVLIREIVSSPLPLTPIFSRLLAGHLPHSNKKGRTSLCGLLNFKTSSYSSENRYSRSVCDRLRANPSSPRTSLIVCALRCCKSQIFSSTVPGAIKR